MKSEKVRDEYFLLTDKVEEINAALEGYCDDIDCDKYTYRDLLKKKYKPVLEHNFSCIDKLNREKSAVMRLLSLDKFKRFRYEKCSVCNKQVDKLSDTSTIVSFTRPVPDRNAYEWNGLHVHKKCEKSVTIPEGWNKQ